MKTLNSCILFALLAGFVFSAYGAKVAPNAVQRQPDGSAMPYPDATLINNPQVTPYIPNDLDWINRSVKTGTGVQHPAWDCAENAEIVQSSGFICHDYTSASTN